jgi:hypothetical protein
MIRPRPWTFPPDETVALDREADRKAGGRRSAGRRPVVASRAQITLPTRDARDVLLVGSCRGPHPPAHPADARALAGQRVSDRNEMTRPDE